MLSAKNRFHGHGSLRYVYKNGQAVRGHLLTIRYSENKRRTTPRVAVVVSKKVYKRAVGRNRIRRRIYEVLRQELPEINQQTDIAVIVFSSEIITIPHDELVTAIRKMLASAQLYKK